MADSNYAAIRRSGLCEWPLVASSAFIYVGFNATRVLTWLNALRICRLQQSLAFSSANDYHRTASSALTPCRNRRDKRKTHHADLDSSIAHQRHLPSAIRGPCRVDRIRFNAQARLVSQHWGESGADRRYSIHEAGRMYSVSPVRLHQNDNRANRASIRR
jgi:hypothetical protein